MKEKVYNLLTLRTSQTSQSHRFQWLVPLKLVEANSMSKQLRFLRFDRLYCDEENESFHSEKWRPKRFKDIFIFSMMIKLQRSTDDFRCSYYCKWVTDTKEMTPTLVPNTQRGLILSDVSAWLFTKLTHIHIMWFQHGGSPTINTYTNGGVVKNQKAPQMRR